MSWNNTTNAQQYLKIIITMGCDSVRQSISISLTILWVDLTGVLQNAGRFTLHFRFLTFQDVSRCINRRYQKPLEVVSF